MEEYDVDPVLGVLLLMRANEIDFDVAADSSGFHFNFEDSNVYDLDVFNNPGRSPITHLAVLVRYRGGW